MKKFLSILLSIAMAANMSLTVLAAEMTELQVETLRGGDEETIEVEVTVEHKEDGTVETTMEAEDFVTDSGLTVTFESTKVEDEGELISEESTYEVEGGRYTAEGGSETTVETVLPEEGDEVTADVIQNGSAVITPPQEGSAADPADPADPQPTNPGDQTKEENPAEYDQTTVTETEREVVVENIKVEVKTGDAVFVDQDGNPVEFEGEDGFNYYYEDIYCIHNISESDCPKCGWSVGGSSWYAVKNDGSKRYIDGEGVCQRVVSCDNGTPDDTRDDYVVNGLYCLDASTGIQSDYNYRKANLEDAVEAGYYSEEDVAHLRAIMKYGYTWNDDKDNGATNLANIKSMITEAKRAIEEKDEAERTPEEEETLALLDMIDLDTLTQKQAANATGMAVWHYGNRFNIADDEHVEIRNGNENVDNLYKYFDYAYRRGYGNRNHQRRKVHRQYGTDRWHQDREPSQY